MRALVAVKQVVDPSVTIQVRTDGSGIDTATAKLTMNPFREIAVEEAIRQREAGNLDKVVVVSVGPDKAQETLRTALAMGADRAILIRSEGPVEPLDVARLITEVVRAEAPGLVLMGKQAIDDEAHQTGQMLAAILGWGQATCASKLVLHGGSATVTRETDGGQQVVELTLPAIVTADLRLNEPRYASLPNIMKAKMKPLELVSPAELGVTLRPRLKVVAVEAPPARPAGVRLGSAAELVERLKGKSGVL